MENLDSVSLFAMVRRMFVNSISMKAGRPCDGGLGLGVVAAGLEDSGAPTAGKYNNLLVIN